MTVHGEDRGREPTTADLAARARGREVEDGGDGWTEGSEGAPLDTDLAREVPADRVALLETGESDTLRSAWEEIQRDFVDDPRRSVDEADRLVARLMSRLAETFADERSRLEDRWERGEDVTTEDLRIALRRYRSFFDRLLAF